MRMMTRCNGLRIVKDCRTDRTTVDLPLKTGHVVSLPAYSLGHAIAVSQLPRVSSFVALAGHREALLEVEGGFFHMKDFGKGIQMIGTTADPLHQEAV